MKLDIDNVINKHYKLIIFLICNLLFFSSTSYKILNPSYRYCLVFDNAKIHHAKKLKTLRSYLKIFFLPPYSPFLNPIKEIYGLTKLHYR